MNKVSLTKTRFAPSPTGMLHVGGARTALFNYIFAKKNKGGFVLRVEDTDVKRSLDIYAEKQYQDLCWLGLHPDESSFSSSTDSSKSYKQSERADIYQKYLEILIKEKKAYLCFCTDSELSEEKRKYLLVKGRKNYKYSRKCLHLKENKILENIKNELPFSVRFFVDNKKNYTFEDGVRGSVKFSGNDVEDFIISRRNKKPLLNFAVVIDDHEMGITDVIRAEEHLTNTAKQVAIYESLKWEVPNFFHISIIVNSERKKISKRDKNNDYFIINKLKENGYLPQAINNYLFFLGFNPILKGTEVLSLNEMVESFDKSRFNSRPSVFSVEKLNWFNSQLIKTMKDEEFDKIVKDFLGEYSQKDNIDKIARTFKNQINCFSEITSLIKVFFSEEDAKFETDQKTEKLIKNFHKKISLVEYWTEDSVLIEIKDIISSLEKNEKKIFLKSIRKLLTGEDKGPEIYKVIYLLGKETTEKKLSKFINDAYQN